MYFQVLFWMQAAIEGQERRLSYGAHAVLARLLYAWISQTVFAVREGVLCLLGSSVRAESVFCARALVAFATQTEQDAMLSSRPRFLSKSSSAGILRTDSRPGDCVIFTRATKFSPRMGGTVMPEEGLAPDTETR
eukprot:scaffold145_cov261-Pinguiococcus_pyrenoidosus.AAC.30